MKKSKQSTLDTFIRGNNSKSTTSTASDLENDDDIIECSPLLKTKVTKLTKKAKTFSGASNFKSSILSEPANIQKKLCDKSQILKEKSNKRVNDLINKISVKMQEVSNKECTIDNKELDDILQEVSFSLQDKSAKVCIV